MSCDHELANEWARCSGKNASYIAISDVLSQKLDSKDIVHKTYLNSLLFYITEKRNVSQVYKRLYYMNTDDIPAVMRLTPYAYNSLQNTLVLFFYQREEFEGRSCPAFNCSSKEWRWNIVLMTLKRHVKADLHGTTLSHTTSLRQAYHMDCFV